MVSYGIVRYGAPHQIERRNIRQISCGGIRYCHDDGDIGERFVINLYL